MLILLTFFTEMLYKITPGALGVICIQLYVMCTLTAWTNIECSIKIFLYYFNVSGGCGPGVAL